VQVGRGYAVVISTNSGLWRYQIGDTITFTNTSPYKFRILGRTKSFINAFGEELMAENAEYGIGYAAQCCGAQVRDYTAAPIFLESGHAGLHQWLIEFERPPDDLSRFTQILDEALRKVNSDYDAKRHKNLALLEPQIIVLPEGTFYRWLQSRNKLGGQHKVPRLVNHREISNAVLEFL
ncbi:MAG: GH3 auxin-responsive promoter family protein, partial [Sphingomonadales bacterium]|nr:GH3 auxin-responsive promoter family protein [Sphingomonadales bacterium]